MRTLRAPSPRAQLRASGSYARKMRKSELLEHIPLSQRREAYLIDRGWRISNRNRSVKHAGESRPPEYAWLCSSCCRHLTIRVDQEFGVLLVPKNEGLENREFG